MGYYEDGWPVETYAIQHRVLDKWVHLDRVYSDIETARAVFKLNKLGDNGGYRIVKLTTRTIIEPVDHE